MQIFQGKSVFGGIAIGKISVYRKKEQQVRRRSVDDPEAEIGRYAWAREEAIAQLQKLYEKALREIGETNAA
ncbi:MAG: phosphoenolpyruvate-utilizing N-terminal domain-containing protein, partial [Clostridium sp.]|nr:phosphoenolpyruvate-utilizing N-terminal domain-containing protein [Clostridium sp.]